MSDPLIDIVRRLNALEKRIGNTELTEVPGNTQTWSANLESSNPAGGSYTTINNARYQRIGSLVIVTARVAVSSFASAPVGGNLRVTGLPFTSANITSPDLGGVGKLAFVAGLAGVTTGTGLFIPPNTTYMEFYNTASIVAGSIITSTSNVSLMAVYIAA